MELAIIIISMLFCVVSAIRPFKIGKLPINMATGSILILIILLLTGIIDIEILKQGILGSNNLKPWQILIIFYTVAYISISVDVTGIFDYLAYRIVQKSKGDGIKLFLFFYLFACALTLFTSNDIVILTLTPIIIYLGKHANMNVVPLLFAEFFGANTLSMFLFIGNPTNIIVGNALGFGFLDFTKTMWLPTIVAAIANVLFLFLFFRKSMTLKYKVNLESMYYIRNWTDAILSSVLLIIMLGVLTASQTLKIPIWIIVTVFSAIFVILDLIFGLYYTSKYRRLSSLDGYKSKEEICKLHNIPEVHNEFFITFKRMPWKILPFVTVFFVLIAGLDKYGAVDWMAKAIINSSSTLGRSIAINGTLGFILANIMNNQPMTILLSSVFTDLNMHTSSIAFQGGAYAVIIASNLGANLTLIGALAGLMWKKILSAKNIEIKYMDFAKIGFIITPAVFILSLITLYFVL